MQENCGVPFVLISIHALRGEGDYGYSSRIVATNISIHALRGEGDDMEFYTTNRNIHFNPRPPWGGRLDTCVYP